MLIRQYRRATGQEMGESPEDLDELGSEGDPFDEVPDELKVL